MNLNLINLLGEAGETAEWIVSSFPIIKLVIMGLILLCSIFMIVAVMAQQGNTNGMTGITGESDTFYNRNKGQSMQGKIKKWTVIDAVAILSLCLIYLVLNSIYAGGI